MATRIQTTNFIRHQIRVRELFIKDKRLSALHVSLYFALFFEWNENRFQNPFYIHRAEIMNGSKIGSANTYTKCLKELDLFGYLKYMPSYNSNKGSMINLYTFDNGTDIGCDNGTDNGTDNGGVQVVIPFNKHTKQKKNKKSLSNFGSVDLKKIDQAKSEEVNRSLFSDSVCTDNLHSSANLSNNQSETFTSKTKLPPDLKDVQSFFTDKNSNNHEAEKFFNHFESNGWLVGGKTKMKNWQAAARNWILNSGKFNQPHHLDRSLTMSKDDHLHAVQKKDYSIPL